MLNVFLESIVKRPSILPVALFPLKRRKTVKRIFFILPDVHHRNTVRPGSNFTAKTIFFR